MKQRRKYEQVKKEKMKYWHLIKRDVLKHKREMAEQEAQERVEQSRRLKRWLHYVDLRNMMQHIWVVFEQKK